MERKVLVSVADGCQAMEAVIPIDILRRAGTNVTVASVEDKLEISTSCEVKLVADKLVRDCEAETYDLVVIPGGMPGAVRLRDSLPLKRIVEKQVKEERFYAAICAAPAVVLQPWGLLAGKQATTHPAFVSDLEDPSFAEQRVVIDGFLVTSRGPGTAFEFALKLVETLCGQETCESVKGPMVMRKDDNDDVFRREYNLPPFGLASNKETPPKVLVPIANGSEEMEAIIVIDVLRRAGASVFVASVEGSLQIEASRKVKIVADMAIQDVQNQEFDLVVIPGGMPGAERLRDSNELTAILEEQSQKRRLTAAICAAPAVVLQSHGLLEGKKATSHPAFSSQLADQTAVEARVVMDGWLTTSRGPGTAMEFALALVERLYGVEKAAELAGNMVVFPPLVSTSV